MFPNVMDLHFVKMAQKQIPVSSCFSFFLLLVFSSLLFFAILIFQLTFNQVVQRIAPKAAIWGLPLVLAAGWVVYPATCKNWSGYNGTVPTGLSYLTSPPKDEN